MHNFYVDVEPGIRVGVWHYVPENHKYNHEEHSKFSLDKHLKRYLARNEKNTPVMIYVHGNDRDRYKI